MHIRIYRFRKEYRTKGRLFLLSVFLLCFMFIPRSNRTFIFSYFSRKCINDQQVYSRKLDDRIVDYSALARLSGIGKSASAADIRKKASAGLLTKVRSTKYYKIQDLTHSYPYLTRDSKKLLEEIGRRFCDKIEKEGYKGSKCIVTSLTRTTQNVRSLGRSNVNVSENSPHLNGNAFDISYMHFKFRKFFITECDKWYMKEALAEVIYQLRKENKCWATYEKNQGCFHVVAR